VRRERITALMAALAVVGMAPMVWLHFVSEPRREPRREQIDARYAPLKKFLRPGQAGYLSDLPPAPNPLIVNAIPGNRLYLHAQYALAPLVLRPGYDRMSQVVINMADPVRLGELLEKHHLALVAQPAPDIAVARPR
jgi:hypothetical protein